MIMAKLNNIRSLNKNYSKKNALFTTIIIFIFGVLMGIISKSLDNLAIDNTIWWHNIIGKFDLGNVLSCMGIWLLIALTISIYSKTPLRASLNVFLFFLGMNLSYHLWTIIYSGFNPNKYMMIWYSLTILSPLLAFISWYAKGKHFISVIISSFIIGVLMVFCFSIGQWYIYFKSFIDTLIFILSLLVLYHDYKSSIKSLIIGILLSFILANYIHF